MKLKKTLCALALFGIPAVAVANVIRSSKVVPIVDVRSGYLLGASRGKNWIKPQATAPQIKGGETYRLLESKNSSNKAVGSKPRTDEAPCVDTFFIEIKPRKGAIAVGGSWNAMPRAPQTLSNNSAVYRNIVAAILKKNKIQPNVKITQIMRVDLEGDGKDEVLISATNHKGYAGSLNSISPRSLKNEYSMLLLRKVVGGKVVTQMLDEEYYVKDKDFNAPNVFTLAGVWDLNGDGRMEIVTHGRYYEGNWTTVYEMRSSKAVKVLEEGCGA